MSASGDRIAWYSAATLARARVRLPGDGRGFALTFDDGPDPHWTPAVLEVLAQLQIPATFFMVGERAAAHPQLVREVAEAGHALGSHSNTHLFVAQSSYRVLSADLRDGRAAVESAVGAPVRRYRPPRGQSTVVGSLAAARAGLRAWFWSLETRDWDPSTTVAQIEATADQLVAGDIVLMHDALAGSDAPAGGANRSRTVASIEGFVARASAKGLTPVLLPE